MATLLKKSEAKKSYTTVLANKKKKEEEKDKTNPYKNQLSGGSEKTVKPISNPIAQNTTTNSGGAMLKPNTQVLKQMQQNPKEASVIADNSFNTGNTNNVQYQINNQKSKFEIGDNPTKRTQTTGGGMLSDFVPTASADYSTNNTQDTYSKTPITENIRMYLYEAEKSGDKQKLIEAEEIKKALNNGGDENKINEIIVKELGYTPSDKVRKSYDYSSNRAMANINAYLNDPNESDVDKEYIKGLLERGDNPQYINQKLNEFGYNYDRLGDVVDTAKNFGAGVVGQVPAIAGNIGGFVTDISIPGMLTNNMARIMGKEDRFGDSLRELGEKGKDTVETSLAPDPMSGAVGVGNFATEGVASLVPATKVTKLAKGSKLLKSPTVQKLTNNKVVNNELTKSVGKGLAEGAIDTAFYDIVTEGKINPKDVATGAGIGGGLGTIGGGYKLVKSSYTKDPKTLLKSEYKPRQEEIVGQMFQIDDATVKQSEPKKSIAYENWKKKNKIEEEIKSVSDKGESIKVSELKNVFAELKKDGVDLDNIKTYEGLGDEINKAITKRTTLEDDLLKSRPKGLKRFDVEIDNKTENRMKNIIEDMKEEAKIAGDKNKVNFYNDVLNGKKLLNDTEINDLLRDYRAMTKPYKTSSIPKEANKYKEAIGNLNTVKGILKEKGDGVGDSFKKLESQISDLKKVETQTDKMLKKVNSYKSKTVDSGFLSTVSGLLVNLNRIVNYKAIVGDVLEAMYKVTGWDFFKSTLKPTEIQDLLQKNIKDFNTLTELIETGASKEKVNRVWKSVKDGVNVIYRATRMDTAKKTNEDE